MGTTKSLTIYGAEWCADCHEIKAALDKHGITYAYFDIDTDDGAGAALHELIDGRSTVPTVSYGSTVLENPPAADVLKMLNVSDMPPDDQGEPAPKHDLVIVGAGPAALSAAVYTTREDIDTLLFERGVVGGLAAITDKVDNYPGFPEGIEGLALADNLRAQAERFGAVIELGEVTKLTDDGRYKRLETTSGDILARAVLIATGTDYKKVGVPGEKEFYARGVHYCATCDGAFYRGKQIVVIGGGNSAVQEALFLLRFVTHIDMLVRSSIKASEILQHDLDEAVKAGKITVHLQTTTDEIVGAEGHVTKVVGTDKATGKKVEIQTDGVFVFVGLKPNSEFLEGSGVELDEIGFVKTDIHLETAVKGVFAAGDIRSGSTMQIATAVGEGATAALMIREYLVTAAKS